MAESWSMMLPGPADTAALGRQLAEAVRLRSPERLGIDLDGELGAGKSSLTRAFVGALGHTGRVPSPTYTLVEPYAVPGYAVYHVDLYRLADPGELDYLGLADELGAGTIVVTEWPDHGGGRLPVADLVIALAPRGEGREARLTAATPVGRALCEEVARLRAHDGDLS